MNHEQDTTIVLRLPRSQKGRFVRASRAAGGTLAAWILATLDAAAADLPPGTAPPGEAPRNGKPDDQETR